MSGDEAPPARYGFSQCAKPLTNGRPRGDGTEYRMEKWKKRSIDLLTSLAFGSKGSMSVVPYYPQKTELSSAEKKYFRRAVPEKHGISSARMYNMLCELEDERRANIHNLMVLCDGEVIAECSRDGYSVNLSHLSHSMSKSVTGLAVGFLYDDGLVDLDARLADLFPEVKPSDKRFAEITVRMLLNMTSGVSFNEAGAVTETAWTEAFFGSSLKFNPGAKFAYNSMNSYILARIVERLSGSRFIDYVDARLFAPLGIDNYFWEKGPEGIEKGGWGLYMSAESWAKIGQTVLLGGVFSDKRIISEEWLSLATKTQAVPPKMTGDFNYGFQTWVGRDSDEILFNGMLGQNVWICPRNKIVVVVTSGNNELFQDSPTIDIIRKHLSGVIDDEPGREDIKVLSRKELAFFDSRRWVVPLQRKRGLLCFLGIKSKTPFDERFASIIGSYAFANNDVGILPLFVGAMQNNLETGIREIRFQRREEELEMIIKEKDEEYRISVGFYGYKDNVLDFRGEKYMVRALGSALVNGEGVGEYRIELLFPELPNTRMIRITRPSDGVIQMDFSEIPNNKIIDNLLDKATSQSMALGFVMDLLEKRLGDGVVRKKVEKTFSPTLIGADIEYDGYERIIEEENAKRAYESFSVKLLRSVVDKFFKEDKADTAQEESSDITEGAEGAPSGAQKNIFGAIMGKIMTGKK